MTLLLLATAAMAREGPLHLPDGHGLAGGAGADLSLAVSLSPETGRVGAFQTNTLVVINHGPSESSAPWIVYWLDPSFHPATANASQGTIQIMANLFTCYLGALPAGATSTVELVTIPTQAGTFAMYPDVRTAEEDPVPGNNVAALEVTVEPGAGVLHIAEAAYQGAEGATLTVTILRTGGSEGTLGARLTTDDGTAQAGEDFVAVSASLVFEPGEIRKSLPVTLIDDLQPECNEAFAVVLTDPVEGTVLAGTTNATVTIHDLDLILSGTVEGVAVRPDDPLRTGNDQSASISLSRDGSWAGFNSLATDLTDDPVGGHGDVFLRNLDTRTTTLVSVNRFGTGGGNGASSNPRISGDGRFLAFVSEATDMLMLDSDTGADIYLKNLEDGSLELVSINHLGAGGGNGPSHSPLLLGSNGNVVVFFSDATDLISGGVVTGGPGLYVRDRDAGVTRLANMNQAGTGPGNAPAFNVALSSDGQRVAFESYADDLLEGDAEFHSDVFLYDLSTDTLSLASLLPDGSARGGNTPALSADGRYVAFAGPGGEGFDPFITSTFIRDRLEGVTRLTDPDLVMDFAYATPAITPDGRYTAFTGYPVDAPSMGAFSHHVFIYDWETQTTRRVDLPCDSPSTSPLQSYPENLRISDDGRFVFFDSGAPNLTPGIPDPQAFNVFRSDQISGEVSLVSFNWSFTGMSRGFNRLQGASGDGRRAVFLNRGNDLLPSPTHGGTDVFAWSALPASPVAQLRVHILPLCSAGVAASVLTVTNLGPDPATDVVLVHALPEGATLGQSETTAGILTVSDGMLRCDIGTLPRRGGAEITLVYLPTEVGVLNVGGEVSATEPDPLPADNQADMMVTTTLPGPATLLIGDCDRFLSLAWPAEPPGVLLQSSPWPGPPGDWSDITSGILDNGVVRAHLLPAGLPESHGFFRLWMP